MNDLEIGFNKPVSQQLMDKIGANINALIDSFNGYAEYFYTGSTQQFTIPESVTRVLVFASGGGGGGGGGYYRTSAAAANSVFGPGAGGQSAGLLVRTVEVIGGNTVDIIVGAGGAGGAKNSTAGDGKATNGGSGGNTTVVDWGVTAKGATGGRAGYSYVDYITASSNGIYIDGYTSGQRPRLDAEVQINSGYGGDARYSLTLFGGFSGAYSVSNGQDSANASGGTTNSGTNSSGTGGAASHFFNGGDGGTRSATQSIADGSDGGLAAGGGGGSGRQAGETGLHGDGGNGGSGFLYIFW